MWKTGSLVLSNKPNCEDRAKIFHIGNACILVVADGTGGMPGGAEAAEIVIQAVTQIIETSLDYDNPEIWLRLLAEIDEEIIDNPEAGETTVVIATVTSKGIIGVSAGDSGAWLVGTQDYVDLTERQYVKGRLGSGLAPPVAFQASLDQNTLLLASDGLFNYCNPAKICDIVRERNFDQIAQKLTDAVRLPSGELWDDISVVLCRVL